MFSAFGDAVSLAPTFQLGIACARAGIPLMIVAPPSGGKSTVIFACEKYLSEHGEPTRRLNRIGLRGLKALADWLKSSYFATLVNEEYSSIGSSLYMVEKMGEIIGALAYSGSYQDEGMAIDLRVGRLGFLSGVQPLWIKTMMTHPVFATHLREKFLRYYDLPYVPSKPIPQLEAIHLLVSSQNEHEENSSIRIPPAFIKALSFQVGTTRAMEYAPRIERELSRLIPYNRVYPALKFYGERLMFEMDFVSREIAPHGFEVETKWMAYHGLYWCLRLGKVKREEFLDLLGVTSVRSVDRILDEGLRSGWVTSSWNDQHRIYEPSMGMKNRVRLI